MVQVPIQRHGPKDWESNSLVPDAVFQAAESHCAITAMHLRLQHMFGLRASEAMCLKPQESDLGENLLIHRGTKGGRGRVVPISTDAQRATLEAAKALVNPHTGLLGRYGHNLNKTRAHYYYVLKANGITRRESGVTSHGLRHGYVRSRPVWKARFRQRQGAHRILHVWEQRPLPTLARRQAAGDGRGICSRSQSGKGALG
ncbi:MAG: integrase domain-containing protein [Gammaproteobacteria bacterium]|nr:integrase domain-containing protein [Gammaproteobacteria bacterium]